MIEEWRSFLYPLGFLSGIAFGARFIIQWLQSEKEGRSLVSRLFWQLSLIGNVLLVLHSLIQVQFHVCIIQACNGLISWRNLDLMQTKKAAISIKKMALLLVLVCLLVMITFMVQQFFLPSHESWFRIPLAPWQTQKGSLSMTWHLIGFAGYILFSSRFWIQWWFAEQAHKSYLPPSFWWLSLIGAIASSIYFLHIRDLVNLIGPIIGLVPYVRNLMLIYKTRRISQRV